MYNRFVKSEEDHVRDVLAAAVAGANERNPNHVSLERPATISSGPDGIGKNIFHRRASSDAHVSIPLPSK